jgi:hypothetical protein
MGDYGITDTLSVSLSSSATSMTVADSSIYSPRWNVQIDNELMYVKSLPSATVVGLSRGHMGTTAATHVVSSQITIQPAFANVEYLDAINAGLEASFPALYKPVAQEYTGLAAETYEYELPDMTGLSIPIPYVYRLEIKDSGDTVFGTVRNWDVIRSATPILKFGRALVGGGTLRVLGFGPFAPLGASDSLDAFFPANAEDFLVEYACQRLLASGEARRVRQDVGMPDSRENATRTGSGMAASNALYSRANNLLSRAAMAPMPKHVKATF